MTELTPLEKARAAKAANQLAKKMNEKPVEDKIDENLSEPKEELEDTEIDDTENVEQIGIDMEKVDMVLDKIPLIEQCKTICDFILEHYGLQKQFQGYLDLKAEERNTREVKSVMEYYGILDGTVDNFKAIVFNNLDHVDIVCKYLAYKNIEFDRTDFRYKPTTKDDRRYEYKQPQQTGNAGWRP